MSANISGAFAVCFLLSATFASRSLFQSSIQAEVSPVRFEEVEEVRKEQANLAFLGLSKTQLKVSLSDFKPESKGNKSDPISDLITSIGRELDSSEESISGEEAKKLEIDSLFNVADSAAMEKSEADTLELTGDESSSWLSYAVASNSLDRRTPSLISANSSESMSGSTGYGREGGLAVARRRVENQSGSGAVSGAVGSGGVPPTGSSGGVSGGSFGAGMAAAQQAAAATVSQNSSSGLVRSGVDGVLSLNGSLRSQSAVSLPVADLGLSSRTVGTTLLASSSRPQLTADGKFGIPNHQYWTFDFKDVTGPSGTADGVVDKLDADSNFQTYLDGLRPKLEAARQVVKWNPLELRGIYDDLNTQVPTTDPAKSPNYLTFMIIDFPVKGFYLPKQDIPSNPGLPPGGLD